MGLGWTGSRIKFVLPYALPIDSVYSSKNFRKAGREKFYRLPVLIKNTQVLKSLPIIA